MSELLKLTEETGNPRGREFTKKFGFQFIYNFIIYVYLTHLSFKMSILKYYF